MHSESGRIAPAYGSFLDCARWTAAALVFAQHLRTPILIGYPDLPAGQRNAIVTLFYLIAGLGSSAVVIFFVLSGFLVGGIGMAKLEEGRFRPRDYAVDRATRLFLAYWPALALTWALDAAGQRWFGRSGLWDCGQVPMCRNFHPGFVGQLTWPTLGINLAMLQSFRGSYFGSNKPLWSLSFEFWFYVVFGLAASAMLGRGARRAGWLAAAAAVTALLGARFMLLGGLWVIGASVARYRSAHPGQCWPACAAFVAATLLMRGHDLESGWTPLDIVAIYANGLSFAWLLVALRGRPLHLFARTRRLNRAVADMSYTLYLLHFPLMLFLLGAAATWLTLPGFRFGYSPFSPAGLALYACVLAIVPPICWVVAQLTEAQTERVRGWLKRRLPVGARPVRLENAS